MLLTRGLLRLFFFLPFYFGMFFDVLSQNLVLEKYIGFDTNFSTTVVSARYTVFRAFGVHRPAAVQSDTSLKMFRAHNECSRVYIV